MQNKTLLIVGVAILAVLVFFGGSVTNGVQAASGDDAFTKWDYLFKLYGQQFGVPWRWLKAICMNESSLGQNSRVLAGLQNPSDEEASKSSDGKSWGLMQVTKATAKGLEGRTVSVAELNQPDFSVRLAAKLINQLMGRFGVDDKESIVRAYNGGPNFGALTLPYWAKFQTNLAIIIAAQPGDEYETS